MNYYIVTNYWDYDKLRNAIVKGRDDIHIMWERLGCIPIEIPSIKASAGAGIAGRLKLDRRLGREWTYATSDLKAGDTLVVHWPPSEKFSGLGRVIDRLRRRGVRIITIIYDLETITRPAYSTGLWIKRRTLRRLEEAVVCSSYIVIAHNEVMKRHLIAAYKLREEQIICQGIFDYLMEESLEPRERTRDGAVIFAGDLSRTKSGFCYELPENQRFNLYGPMFEGETSGASQYKGAYAPDALMQALEGSWGLLWDGASTEGASGAWGESIKLQNPHKASLYLAAGLPVIAYRGAAIADFLVEKGCGITIERIGDIPEAIASIDDETYRRLAANAAAEGNRLRAGCYSENAFSRALEMAEEN